MEWNFEEFWKDIPEGCKICPSPEKTRKYWESFSDDEKLELIQNLVDNADELFETYMKIPNVNYAAIIARSVGKWATAG